MGGSYAPTLIRTLASTTMLCLTHFLGLLITPLCSIHWGLRCLLQRILLQVALCSTRIVAGLPGGYVGTRPVITTLLLTLVCGTTRAKYGA